MSKLVKLLLLTLSVVGSAQAYTCKGGPAGKFELFQSENGLLRTPILNTAEFMPGNGTPQINFSQPTDNIRIFVFGDKNRDPNTEYWITQHKSGKVEYSIVTPRGRQTFSCTGSP